MFAAQRTLGVVFAGLALVGCFDFKDDLITCALPGYACATDSGADADADADAGVDSGIPTRASYCTSPVECLSGSCVDGCCDQACTGVTDIVAGYGTSCAVVTDGTVRCWGENRQGQALGELTADGGNALVPVQVRNVANARKVVLGDEFACALLADQTVSCWGRSDEGQLGRDPSTADRGCPRR